MSVNGQDYRSNVYLLDGTLQNDFTNGPAGSAAGTALGMESIREFRVEIERLQRGVRPQLRRADQRPDQVGHEHGARQRLRVPPQRRARRAQLLRRRRASRTSRATSSAASLGGPLRAEPAVLLRRLRRAAREPRQDHHELRPRRQRAPRHPARRPGRRSATPSARISTRFRAANGPSIGGGLAHAHLRASTRRSNETFLQGRIDYQRGAAHQFFARYTLRRCASSGCRPITRSSRARSSRRNQFFTARVPQRPLGSHAADGALRLQPHAHRPERRGQPRVAAAAVRRRAAASSATSTSAACSGSGRRPRPISGWRRTSTVASTT